jgi:hypothetical protein
VSANPRPFEEHARRNAILEIYFACLINDGDQKGTKYLGLGGLLFIHASKTSNNTCTHAVVNAPLQKAMCRFGKPQAQLWQPDLPVESHTTTCGQRCWVPQAGLSPECLQNPLLISLRYAPVGWIASLGSCSNHTEIAARSDHISLNMPSQLPGTVSGRYTLSYTHEAQLHTTVGSCKQPVARPCTSLQGLLLQKADQGQSHRANQIRHALQHAHKSESQPPGSGLCWWITR